MIWIGLDLNLWESSNFYKNGPNVDFSENSFFSGVWGGIKLYIVYMISKIGCDWFHQALTCFALKMRIFVKSDKERRILSFSWIHRIWSMQCLSNRYCTYMWLVRIHGIGNWACLLGFWLKCSITWNILTLKDEFD
jgi:hypothetical protein